MSNKFSSPSLSVLRATPQYVPLTDICQPKQWKTIPKAELKTKGYPVYGANGLIGYSDEYNHENKTILIACRGASCGAINVCLPKSYVTGNAMCLDNLNEEFDLDFLQHYLQTYDFKKAISGSAQPQITRSELSLIMIPILPVSLQRKISCILSAVDENKKQAEQTVKYLDSLIKSRFVEMFGDPVQNSFHWRMAPLGGNAKLINGRAYKQNELHISGKYPVLRVGNFFSNRDWYYSDLELNEKKYCDNGDLLYAWSASFGPKIWDGGKVIYHYHIWKVEVGDAYNKHFLCKLLKYAEKSFLGDTHGIGMLHLTKSGMEEAPFIVPPRDLQDRFADFVQQVDKLRFATQQQIDKLETLKKSLMQEYFG